MGNWIWICVGISLFAFLLNVFKNKICFLIWNVSTVGFVIHFYIEKNWPFVILWIFYFFVNFYGYFEWKHREEEEDKEN